MLDGTRHKQQRLAAHNLAAAASSKVPEHQRTLVVDKLDRLLVRTLAELGIRTDRMPPAAGHTAVHKAAVVVAAGIPCHRFPLRQHTIN